MVKKIVVLLAFFYTLGTVAGGFTFAQNGEDAGKKAEEFHQRAMSDVIFIDEELKASYYQNVQIVDLLQEIRELLRQQLEEIKENLKQLEEIKENLKSVKERQENVVVAE